MVSPDCCLTLRATRADNPRALPSRNPMISGSTSSFVCLPATVVFLCWSFSVSTAPGVSGFLDSDEAGWTHEGGHQEQKPLGSWRDLRSFVASRMFGERVPYLETTPLPDKPEERFKPRLKDITYHRCIDADRCVFTLPQYRRIIGDRVLVRLAGVETPHLRGECEQETSLAKDAVDLLEDVLSHAAEIHLSGDYMVGVELVARVEAEGQDLSELLVAQGLAVPYEQRPAHWCGS